MLVSSGDAVLAISGADVGVKRESQRRRRLWRLSLYVGVPALFLWWRILDRRPFDVFNMPNIDWTLVLPMFLIFWFGRLCRDDPLVAALAPHAVSARADRRTA